MAGSNASATLLSDLSREFKLNAALTAAARELYQELGLHAEGIHGAERALAALALEADGTVTTAALEAFKKAIALQPNDARALYYLGLHEAQAGDSAAAVRRWRELEAPA